MRVGARTGRRTEQQKAGENAARDAEMRPVSGGRKAPTMTETEASH